MRSLLIAAVLLVTADASAGGNNVKWAARSGSAPPLSAEWAVFEGVDNAHLHAASHRAEPLRTSALLPDYQYKRGGYSGDDSTSPQTDPAGNYYGDYSGGVHTGSYGAVSVQGTSQKAARRAPSSHQSHVAQHPARKAAAAEGSDAAARAAMHAAIHPGTAASKKTTPKKATPPKTSSPPAADGAVSGAAEAAASYTDHAVSPAAEAAAVADKHEAAADERSLQRQWADAMGVVAPARAESRRRIARQGLLATPNGMAQVHRDGAAVGAAGTAQSFHANAAAEVLETYLGKHTHTESHALFWICGGAALVLGAVVLVIASEMSVVALVRGQMAQPAPQAAEAVGGAKDFSSLEEGAASSTSLGAVAAGMFGSSAYLPYRPYVTLLCMMSLFVGLMCVLSPVCDVLDVLGIPSASCFLNVVFVALVVTLTGMAFLMGCCWAFTRPYASFVLFSIALSGGLMCNTGISVLVVLWMVMSLAVFLCYFVFLPDAEEVPVWCESVGPIKASMDPEAWKRLATPEIPHDLNAAYQYEYVHSTPGTSTVHTHTHTLQHTRKSVSV